jgi:hypothetical protein
VIHLGDVYIASWKDERTSGRHLLQFTLEFVSIRVDGGEQPADGKPDSPRWDPGPGG